MWLSIIDGSVYSLGTIGKLYFKKIDTGFVPTPGEDEITLFDDAEDEGPLWYVKRRYMGSGGEWHIELAHLVLDPNEGWQEHFRNRIGLGRKIIRETAWYTDRDGDPFPRLTSGGWLEYTSKSQI